MLSCLPDHMNGQSFIRHARDFHTPLESACLRPLSKYEDNTYESISDNEHEASIMQRLYEARKRLESGSAENDAHEEVWLKSRTSTFLSPNNSTTSLILPIPRAKSPSPSVSAWSMCGEYSKPSTPVSLQFEDQQLQERRASMKNSQNRPPSLTLDLKDVPYSAFIDAERRRLSEVPSASQSHEPLPPQHVVHALASSAPVPPDNSGSRYGMAPFTDLERDEWVWQCDEHRSPRSKASDSEASSGQEQPLGLSSSPVSKLSHAQEEWAWVVSGAAYGHRQDKPATPLSTPTTMSG